MNDYTVKIPFFTSSKFQKHNYDLIEPNGGLERSGVRNSTTSLSLNSRLLPSWDDRVFRPQKNRDTWPLILIQVLNYPGSILSYGQASTFLFKHLKCGILYFRKSIKLSLLGRAIKFDRVWFYCAPLCTRHNYLYLY